MRPSWDEYFLKLAMLASERATCPRMHCGCVLVKDRHVLATGYNGSLPSTPHCEDVGCLMVDNHCIRTNHAEMNAVAQAARHGIAVAGAVAYITNMPCTTCAKMLAAAGIVRVIVFSDYHDTRAERLFLEVGVDLRYAPMPSRSIDYDLDAYVSARRRGPNDGAM